MIGLSFTHIITFSGYSSRTTVTIPDISKYKALCFIGVQTFDDIRIIDITHIIPMDFFRVAGTIIRSGFASSHSFADGTEVKYLSDTSVEVRNVNGSLFLYGIK